MEIQMWKEILTPYDLAVEELPDKIQPYKLKNTVRRGVYSPIEQEFRTCENYF